MGVDEFKIGGPARASAEQLELDVTDTASYLEDAGAVYSTVGKVADHPSRGIVQAAFAIPGGYVSSEPGPEHVVASATVAAAAHISSIRMEAPRRDMRPCRVSGRRLVWWRAVEPPEQGALPRRCVPAGRLSWSAPGHRVPGPDSRSAGPRSSRCIGFPPGRPGKGGRGPGVPPGRRTSASPDSPQCRGQ